jgi:Zn-dependent membrane protease YugP
MTMQEPDAARAEAFMLAEAGFRDISVETVDGDIANNYDVAMKA